MNKLLVSLLIASGFIASTTVYAETTGRGLYLQALAGAGRSDGDQLKQTTTVYAGDYVLPVDVSGNVKNDTFGLGGLGIGYEWQSNSSFKPALEFEALYLSGDQKAKLKNKKAEVGIPEEEELLNTVLPGHHTFKDSFDNRNFAFMLNGIVSYDTGTMWTPYAGVGIGMARTKMKNSKSTQTCKFYGEGTCAVNGGGVETDPKATPGAPVVNHFNTDDEASDNVFAAQAKLGLRAELSKNLSMFAEYRYLRLNSASYTFGRTDYPNHLDTDRWQVKTDATDFHLGTVGVQYSF